MTQPLHYYELRDDADPAARERWLHVQNRIWPEWAQTDAELLHELQQMEAARAWFIVDTARGVDVGGIRAERIPWHEPDTPPVAIVMLDDKHRSRAAYVAALEPCAAFAREHDFDELRVYAWERETDIVSHCQSLAEWSITERAVDMRLDLASRPTKLMRRPVPEGISIYSFAERPDLMPGAHAALVAALPEIPGDATHRTLTYEAWERDHEGPFHLPEARWAAVDDVTGTVLGMHELEVQALVLELAGELQTGFTAVHPDARRRGVALALKQAGIAWAQAQGAKWLRTENEERNAPMRSLNEQLGFGPAPARVLLRGPLASMRPE